MPSEEHQIPAEEPVAVAQKLINEMGSLKEAFVKMAERVNVADRLSSRAWRLTLFDIFLTVALTVVSIILGVTLNSTSDSVHRSNLALAKAEQALAQVQRTAESSYQSCLESNQIRAGNEKLWSFVYNSDAAEITASKAKFTPTQYAEEQKVLAQFKALYVGTEAPKTCSTSTASATVALGG